LPADLDLRPGQALWITNPVYSTGVYSLEQSCDRLLRMADGGTLIVADESLALRPTAIALSPPKTLQKEQALPVTRLFAFSLIWSSRSSFGLSRRRAAPPKPHLGHRAGGAGSQSALCARKNGSTAPMAVNSSPFRIMVLLSFRRRDPGIIRAGSP
ncbi:MAG: hypothetical protein ACXW3S_16880, partial [Rhodoplanes sp.]